jgi:hypothetical protein
MICLSIYFNYEHFGTIILYEKSAKSAENAEKLKKKIHLDFSAILNYEN